MNVTCLFEKYRYTEMLLYVYNLFITYVIIKYSNVSVSALYSKC
jgi:hypothetical protein